MKKLFFYIVLMALFTACGKGFFISGKKSTIKEAQILNDSLQKSWQLLTNADQRKFSNIKRLLDEVSYTGTFDSIELSKIRTTYLSTIKKQLNQKTMTSAEIDQFDLSTDSLIRSTFQLVENTKELSNHSIVEPLKNEILNDDNDVVIYRINYDRKAKEYNTFIGKNAQNLNKVNPPYQALPLFELSE